MKNKKTKGRLQCLFRLMGVFVLSSFFSISAFAQEPITVDGKVIDEIGEGVPGVSVVIDGTSTGTLTDIDGLFKIKVPSSKAVLRFSFIGYHTGKVTVGSQTSINYTLVEDTKTLDEVVVVGYGIQKKETVTGSISTIKGDDFLKSPSTNLSNSIAGRMSGVVTFQRSGEPGGDGTTIRIRGSNTLGNNEPLIVIDGVAARAGGLDRLDANEIESMSVLKDASAAIYGSRAANGVILVTTKRGDSNVDMKPEVTYSFNAGWARPSVKPQMANAAEYAILRNELLTNAAAVNPNTGKTPEKVTPWKTADEIQKYRDGSDPWRYPNTNWWDATIADWSPQRMHNATLSGGNKKFQYYTVFGHKFQDGLYKNSANSYEQSNLRINLDAQVNEWISLSVGMLGRQENKNYPSQSAGDVFVHISRGRPTDQAYWPNGLPGPAQERGHNPVVASTNATGSDKRRDYFIQTNASVNVKLPWVEGLKLTGSVSYDKQLMRRTRWFQPWTLYNWDGSTVDENDIPKLNPALSYPQHADPDLKKWSADQTNRVLSALANYERTFGDHSVNFLVGTERDESDKDEFNAYRRYFLSSALHNFAAGGDKEKSNEAGDIWNRARVNFFGRMAYNFQEKYLAEFLWRVDGSYMFPRNKRYGFFPGVLLGYRISEENFWKENVSFIDYLKIRGSWGKMGNDNIYYDDALQEYQFLNTYKYAYGYIIGGEDQQALAISKLPNPSITWEVADNYNIGIEGRTLNQRLYFELDYFYNQRKDILWRRNASIPETTGLTLPAENIGKVNNTGFDFKLEWNDFIGKDFRYSISATGGYAKNTIKFWDESPGAPEWQKSTGHPIETKLYYVFDGVFKDWDEINDPNRPNYDGVTKDANLQPGDMKFKDVDGDGFVTPDDRKRYDKNAEPKWTYGINAYAEYKGFDLSMLWQGAADAWTRRYFDSGEMGNYYKRIYDNRWSPDNPSSKHPRVHARGQYYWDSGEGLNNTYWMVNLNYIRLKNIELGYTLPKNVVEKTRFFESMRVYMNGLNLLTFSPSKELDPESNNEKGSGYPLTKVINFGFSVTF